MSYNGLSFGGILISYYYKSLFKGNSVNDYLKYYNNGYNYRVLQTVVYRMYQYMNCYYFRLVIRHVNLKCRMEKKHDCGTILKIGV